MISYIETSIPAGMTITDYRRSRPRRPRLLERMRGRFARIADETRAS